MIDNLLQPYQRFGVHLGLERIKLLLEQLGNPHLAVPIIHVAGSNGKGSVCAYLSTALTEAGYLVGRYTSPHLVRWTERICLNNQEISEELLSQLLEEIGQVIGNTAESPTQFEVLTAAAWLYFARSKVDLAVIEVGLGGRLDATNVCPDPLVTVITSISWEHWQNLGPTIADIAKEKAGILKPGRPAIIGEIPPEAAAVIKERIDTLGCPAIWIKPATEVEGKATYQGLTYHLPLGGKVQLHNSALALAALDCFRNQGWRLQDQDLVRGIEKTRWAGRMEWLEWSGKKLLIDGAHNRAGAIALREYLDRLNTPVTLVIGMLSTKDHQGVWEGLLRPQDLLYLVPVPDHSSANLEELARLAWSICPDLAGCEIFEDLFPALTRAQQDPERLTVLAGSLYLLGYFLAAIN